MRRYKGRDVLAGAVAFLLAVSLAGCCRDKNDADHSLSLLGGLLAGGGGNQAPVPLGCAASFRVLADSVTNTGPTSVDGDLGVSPGSACSGFPAPCTGGGPGTVSGTIYIPPSIADAAKGCLTTAYLDAQNRPPGTSVSGNIGGETLAPGVFTASSSLAISSGDLTLTGLGDSNAVFIFQIPTTLTVTTGRRVILADGAQASNIFWQVGSSATLGTNSDFSGIIMAQIAITMNTGATLHGRALTQTAAVMLDTNVIAP